MAGAALALASGQATTCGSRSRVTRQADGDVNSNANGTQARPSPPQPPPRPSLPGCRTQRPTASEPQVPPPAPEPSASSSRRSQRGRILDRINARTPGQAQAFDSNRIEGANSGDDERGKRAGKREKKNVSWDPKENGQTNSKRKASNAVEVIEEGQIRASARRRVVSDSSNGPNGLGPSQQTQRSAAVRTLAAGSGIGSGAGTSSSGTNLTIPDLVVAHAPDPVSSSSSPSTLSSPRGEIPSPRPVRLRLIQTADSHPDHPDHEAYLIRQAKRWEQEME